jgi:F-type H+-transporting ATPase subunit epsilon
MVLKVELVSPERIAYSGEAKMVIARTIEGDIAFLPGHVPFIGVLDTYPVRVLQEDDQAQVIAVHQGFVEVAPDGDDTRVTILSDVCELSEVIDVKRAERSRETAQHQLTVDPDDAEAQAALARAEVRLAVAEGRPTDLRSS